MNIYIIEQHFQMICSGVFWFFFEGIFNEKKNVSIIFGWFHISLPLTLGAGLK